MVNRKLDCFSWSHIYVNYDKGYRDSTARLTKHTGFPRQSRVYFCPSIKAVVRTGHGTTDWFQIGKGVRQGCILSLCLFNLYAEYIMRNAGLEEAQAGIKIARRNINNLRYADDTTLMAEREEKLKAS